MTALTLVPRSWRALAIVFGDFTRAWREFDVGETFGHPASNHASITPANDTRRSRRGPGSSDCARSATNSSRSLCAAAMSTRSTFRRDSSGNRIQAIHRRHSRHQPKGYVQTGYVNNLHQDIEKAQVP
jgi:hypothetical protein